MLLVCMPVQQCMPRIWMVACYYVGPMSSAREGCNGAVALVSLSPIHLYVDFLLTVFFCDPESSCRILFYDMLHLFMLWNNGLMI